MSWGMPQFSPLSDFTIWLALASAAICPAQAQELRNGGKLLLTNGVSTIEGSGGGGIATWSTIAGNATEQGIGA